MKKKFKPPKDLRVALDNAIKEAEKEIPNNPPLIIASRKRGKPKEIIANILLKKWWRKNGIKIMRRVARECLNNIR